MRESTKYEHVVGFADALPEIRKKVQEHMSLRGLQREKVLATVVHLLETTLIRVGNDEYAEQNNSYGLTTLKNRHVAVDGNEVRFRFTGKSGKQWSLRVRDRRVAKIIKACQELPGQELLQYVDEAGNCQDVTSTDVNNYLKEITGQDITAKDFRTWAGTVLAAMALNELRSFDSAAQAKRNLRAAIEKVAGKLGNTSTICRKCYVHPEVLNSYMDGNLVLELKSKAESELRSDVQILKPEEAAVLALLRSSYERSRAPGIEEPSHEGRLSAPSSFETASPLPTQAPMASARSSLFRIGRLFRWRIRPLCSRTATSKPVQPYPVLIFDARAVIGSIPLSVQKMYRA